MIGDSERPDRRDAKQDEALARWVRRVAVPHSLHYTRAFAAAGLRANQVRGRADLRRLAPEDIPGSLDPAALVLRPDLDSIRRSGDLGLLAQVTFARVSGRLPQFNRSVIEPLYKPVHWTVSAGLLTGWSARDLDRLADLGRRWLELAGFRRGDILLNAIPAAPTVDYWQLVLGARRAGVAAIHTGGRPSGGDAVTVQPTAIAGTAPDLIELLSEARSSGRLRALRTILVTGSPVTPADRERIAELASEPVAVVGAWAPPGTRSVWTECREGSGRGGYHTAPSTDVLDRDDDIDGSLLWTGIGWHGTVVLRARTGVAGDIDGRACDACGRTAPRVVPRPTVASVLDGEPALGEWHAELLGDASDRRPLVIYVAPRATAGLDAAMRRVDAALDVAQFVVVRRADLAERKAA